MNEADTLLARSRTNALTAEESARLESCISSAERLGGEVTVARSRERLAQQRTINAEPIRTPSPFVHQQRTNDNGSDAEALSLWMRALTEHADLSADARYRAAQHGFVLGSRSVNLKGGGQAPLTLNREKRRTLSTSGAGLGKEAIPASTFSDRVTEYITFFSPIVSMIESEITKDGIARDYPILDDTALMSQPTSASSGTEINPTIPDANIATASVRLLPYEVTSGFHKITRQTLRDSPIQLQEKIARAIAHSHARRLEYDLCNATGSGSNGSSQGLIAAGTAYGSPVADISQDLLEAMYFSVPEAYRGGCIWFVSVGGKQRMRKVLKDSMNRSLFGKTIEQGIEVETLFERPVITSEQMPGWVANGVPIMFFHPAFYMMRMVDDQQLDILDEKFYPSLAFAGLMHFSGAWLGPAAAIKKLVLTGTPAT